MAWLAVDKDGAECVFENEPIKYVTNRWVCKWSDENCVLLPKGSIKKLLGKELTWDDDPVEIEED